MRTTKEIGVKIEKAEFDVTYIWHDEVKGTYLTPPDGGYADIIKVEFNGMNVTEMTDLLNLHEEIIDQINEYEGN
jgi:hypothetical protein